MTASPVFRALAQAWQRLPRAASRGLLVLLLFGAGLGVWTAALAAIAYVSASEAYDPDPTTVLTLARPANVAVGDLLLAAITQPRSNTINTPSGWTLVTSTQTNSGTHPNLRVFYRVANGTEGTSFSFTTAGSESMAGGIAAFRGIDTSNPIAASASQANSTASTSGVAPAVTPGVANSMLVSVWATHDDGGDDPNVTVPGVMTRVVGATMMAANTAETRLTMAYQALTASTTTGTRSATFSPSYRSTTATVALRPLAYTVSGTVFEDVNYGGGAGRAQAASGGVGVNGASVELYNSSGVFVSSTTTAGGGAYSFASLSSGTYYVRVVNSTVPSQRTNTISTLRGVMTYRTNASTGTPVGVTDYVGGTNPALVDPGAGSSGAAFNTSTGVFTAVLSGTAQSFAPVTVGSANIAGVDFGFNFDTVTNTNDSGPGSLRQAITNANTLGGDNLLRQSGRVDAIENLVFMISNGSSAAGFRSSIDYFTTSAGSYDVATITPATAFPTVSAPLVIDAQTQPGWSLEPLIELNGNGLSATLLRFSAGSSTLRGFVISRLSPAGNSALRLDTAGGNTVQGNWFGTSAAGSSATTPKVSFQLEIYSGSNTIGGTTGAARNVISNGNSNGIVIWSGNSNVIQGNYIGTNAAGTAALGNGDSGIVMPGSSTAIGTLIGGANSGEGNVISGNNGSSTTTGGIAIQGAGSTGTVIHGNRIGLNANGSATIANGGYGIYTLSAGTLIGGAAGGQGNTISGHSLDGVAVVGSSATGVSILGNSIYGNNGIGIDLADNGFTANDGAKTSGQPNLLMDYPVFTSATLSGSTLTVAGYVGSAAGQSAFASSRVEVFIADATNANGQGQTYLGYVTANGSGNFSGTVTLPGSVTLTAGVTRLTGTATDTSNNTSEFGPNVLYAGQSVSGTVFEDLNFGGGAGRSLSTAGGSGVTGATVELYSGSGSYVSSTATAAGGGYTFTGLTSGNYHVRVAGSTVQSTRTSTSGSPVGVLTYRTNASTGSAVAVTDWVGGTNPALADPGAASSGAAFNPSTYVYSTGLTGTAQAVAPVTVGSSGGVTGVDFGFNFSTVVNTNDSGQGSLRQAITNANVLGSDSSLAQSGRTAGIENLVFMISNGTGVAGLRSANNQFTTSAGSYNVATITPTSALPTVAAPLVIDAQTQPGWTANPVIELNGTSAGNVEGFTLGGTGGTTLRGLVINRFNRTGVYISSAGNTVQGSWVGLNAAGTAASRNAVAGVYVDGANNTIGGTSATTRNVVSGNGSGSGTYQAGIVINTGTGNTVLGNYVGLNAAGMAAVPNLPYGIDVGSSGNTIGGTAAGAANVSSGHQFDGLILRASADSNTVQGNFFGTNATNTAVLANSRAGINASSNNNTIGGTAAGAGNVLRGNAQYGLYIFGNYAGTAILGNSIYGNGGIGIDLSGNGLTANDGAKTTGQPNLLMDYPVLTGAALAGSTLTVTGYVGSAAGQSTFASSRVEVFVSDGSNTNGQGQTYLGFVTADASGNFNGTLTVPGSVTLVAGTTQLTATATDTSNNTSEFGPNFRFGVAISGTVFEDINYGGGAGRSLASSGGTGVSGTTVELFNSSGTYVSSTTATSGGSYRFTGLAAGNYYVRVVSSSVLSTRGGSTASLVGVMTYRTTASSGAAVAQTDFIGGSNPALVDPGAAGAGAAFNTSTYVFTSGLSGTAQAVAPITVGGGGLGGVDFGFNFDTVVNTNDSGQGSLRQAITNANMLGGDGSLAQSGRTAAIENLVFMIPNGSTAAGLRSSIDYFSAGVATITPASALPALSTAMVIDAQTQPGWTANPIIELNGASAGSSNGLSLTATGSTLRGLVINRHTLSGVAIAAAGNTVQGCWIGLNAAGTAAAANGIWGVYVSAGGGNAIGGTTAAARNVLSGNGDHGIYVAAGGANTIYGNYIGTNAAGTAAVGNRNSGIYLHASTGSNTVGGSVAGQGNVLSGNTTGLTSSGGSGNNTIRGNLIGRNAQNSAALPNSGNGIFLDNTTNNNRIGGTGTGDGNVISGNGGIGVRLSGAASTGNAIQGNSLYGNGGLGIDLGTAAGAADGVTANDGVKTTGQPGLWMDSPVFTAARARGNQLTVTGYIGTAAGQTTFGASRVEIFLSDNDSTGYGEGRTFLGALTADASGNFSGTMTMPVATLALGNRLTGTATDTANNTSEFGANFNNLVVDFVVNSTLDDADASAGDGQCLTAAGVCTLRAAIAEINAWATALLSTPTVAFALPGCASYGALACQISAGTQLPTLARNMLIDATTQPGWNASSYAPIVVLNGSTAASTASGLVLGSGTHGVRGLVINGFGQNGVLASGGADHVVAGNWIGLNAAGTAAVANGSTGSATAGVFVTNATGLVVGGNTAADRNVLSGNGGSGVWGNGGTSVISGNYIGTNAAGTAAVGNGRWGLQVSAGAHTVGGSATGRGNVISGNVGYQTGGVLLSGTGQVVQGNTIGLNAARSAALPNGDASTSFASGIDVRDGSGHLIGGTNPGEGNVIAGNGGYGIRVSAQAVRILGNSLYSNQWLGIDLNADGVTANDGATNGSQANNGMDHPVFIAAGVGNGATSVTATGYVGTGTGQAAFAGARIELFRAAPDTTGYGEGQTYLGFLIADANGRFNGTVTFAAGLLNVGDALTATATSATDASGRTSEFGPNWTTTTLESLNPGGFNVFETDTALTAVAGVIRTKTGGTAATLAVIALNASGTGLHPGFTGSVSLRWLDARVDTGAASGSCRASWVDLGAAGSAAFSSNARVNVVVTPPANATRAMRLQAVYTGSAGTVTACSNDAFAVLPATLSLAATDADAATAGTVRALSNVAASGGVVHRAGRPFTVTGRARDATGALMTAYDGTPALALAGCLLPASCTPGALGATATTASGGVYSHTGVTYAEVGAIALQLTDSSYAAIDAADTAASTRTLASAVVAVGRFVPDALTASLSGNGVLATANAGCLASGQGATFFGQGLGWASAPQVTLTARNAAGAVTTYWTGALMRLSAGPSLAPALQASNAGSATLSTSFGGVSLADLGGGQVRLTASSLDRFLLGLPAGTVQASRTPTWAWSLAATDASEAAVAGNPTLVATVTQASVGFDSGAVFHSGRLALSAAHGDARAGLAALLHLQRYTAAGWVTMTEDRGCVSLQPQNLGVESPSGVFATAAGACAAPMTSAATTAGGRAWLRLPATPGALPGRLVLRVAGAGASGQSCTAAGAGATLVPLDLPWLLGGSAAVGPAALATWGKPQRDAVLRREVW